MNTKLEISRGPRGLTVHLPSGRTLNVTADAAGAQFIERMLRDADENAKYDQQRSGYLGDFPTQHVVDAWARQDAARINLAEQVAEVTERKREERVEAKRKKWADKGINTDKLKFDL